MPPRIIQLVLLTFDRDGQYLRQVFPASRRTAEVRLANHVVGLQRDDGLWSVFAEQPDLRLPAMMILARISTGTRTPNRNVLTRKNSGFPVRMA